jgi:hypothetical protein
MAGHRRLGAAAWACWPGKEERVRVRGLGGCPTEARGGVLEHAVGDDRRESMSVVKWL